MIVAEKDINPRTLEKVIGNPVKINWKKPAAIGSASFYLKLFENEDIPTDFLMENSKCNFQKYSNGILIRSNYSNKITALAIPEIEIETIKLIRGKENIAPIVMSPMWILLKLGVSIATARYFRIYLREYSINEMKLKIVTTNHTLQFIQNGYIFERQLAFFESLEYQDKLIVELNS